MRKRRIFVFASCYLSLILVFLVVDIQLGLDSLDNGREPGASEQAANLAVSVLLAPADQLWSYIGRDRFGPGVQWLMIIGNAFLWGMLTEAVFSHFYRKRASR